MKRVAILIATTGGPVLVERITPEPAPQSMVCLRRQSDVLPISPDYDDFVRPGSGVIMRDFGPYEEGAFRLDVSGPVGTGTSWQLGVYAAHALFKSEDCVLSSLEEADLIVWMTGTVDYDLNVGAVEHMAEKVESSALLLADFIAKGVPIIFCAAPENAQFLSDHQPPEGICVVALSTVRDLLKDLGLVEKAADRQAKIFWPMAVAAILAVGAVFAFTQQDQPEPVSEKPPLQVSLTTDRGKAPIFYFGEDLNLLVEVTQEAWLTCFYRQSDGHLLRIYPNDQVSAPQRFSPGKTHILSGGPQSDFVIRLGPPAGREEVTCYASPDQEVLNKRQVSDRLAFDRITFDLKP